MRCILIWPLMLAGLSLSAQGMDTSLIARVLPGDQILAPLRYLASDHLKGRHVGLPEIDIAAAYIAEQFRKAGAKPVSGATGYFQVFNHKFKANYSDTSFYGHPIWSNLPLSAMRKGLTLKNVLAVVEGADPVLRNQFVVLSSHYDHVGIADTVLMEDGKRDSIFNGARDNATGTAAIIGAARYFAVHPPKRSVLFICYTAEEEGLIGSEYYEFHPLIPLDRLVYNLNVDNAGYNNTHAVCLFGLKRTSEDSVICKASAAYGLEVYGDPLDGDLFNRGDNSSLAREGIPAPTFSMGMSKWDESILERYHRVSDEVGNMDLDYVVKFIRAYILAAKYIGNASGQPHWAKDDIYEKYWRELYKKSN